MFYYALLNQNELDLKEACHFLSCVNVLTNCYKDDAQANVKKNKAWI